MAEKLPQLNDQQARSLDNQHSLRERPGSQDHESGSQHHRGQEMIFTSCYTFISISKWQNDRMAYIIIKSTVFPTSSRLPAHYWPNSQSDTPGCQVHRACWTNYTYSYLFSCLVAPSDYCFGCPSFSCQICRIWPRFLLRGWREKMTADYWCYLFAGSS